MCVSRVCVGLTAIEVPVARARRETQGLVKTSDDMAENLLRELEDLTEVKDKYEKLEADYVKLQAENARLTGRLHALDIDALGGTATEGTTGWHDSGGHSGGDVNANARKRSREAADFEAERNGRVADKTSRPSTGGGGGSHKIGDGKDNQSKATAGARGRYESFEEVNDIESAIQSIRDAASAEYAANFALRMLQREDARGPPAMGAIARIAKGVLKAVLATASQKSKRDEATIRFASRYVVSAMESARKGSAAASSQHAGGTECDGRHLIRALHMPWWCRKDDARAGILMLLLHFVMLMRKWSPREDGEDAGNGEGAVGGLMHHKVLAIMQALMIQLHQYLWLRDVTEFGRVYTRVGCLCSFIAGMCRATQDVEYYQLLLYNIVVRWGAASAARCSPVSGVLELMYLTVTNIWNGTGQREGVQRDIGEEHSKMFRHISSHLARKTAHEGGPDNKAKAWGDDGVMAAQIQQILDGIRRIVEAGEQTKLAPEARRLCLYCAAYGWVNVRNMGVIDTATLLVRSEMAVLVVQDLLVPLLHIAFDENALLQHADAMGRIPQLREALERIERDIDSYALEGNGATEATASAIKEVVSQRFSF